MASKEYTMKRKSDGVELSMRLDDKDRARYEDAGWNPQLVTKGRAPRARARAEETPDAGDK